MSLAAEAVDHADGRSLARSVLTSNQAIVAAVSILFFCPSILFALTLRPIPALVVIMGCVTGLSLIVWRRPDGNTLLDAPIDVRSLLTCLAAALLLFVLGGETHMFHPPSDWFVRDAVLADIVRAGGPATYTWLGVAYVLRAPLGMYMIPGLIGHSLGLTAAHGALLLQNTFLLGSIFYLLFCIGRGWWHLAIMVAFSGVSIAGVALDAVANGKTDVSIWIGRGLDAWHSMFQFSASLRQFFWAPNHALPGWWLATLLLMQYRARIDVSVIGVTIAALCLWSPLAILPAVPWLATVALTSPRSVFLSRRTWAGAASALCSLPTVAYLMLASGTMAHTSPVTQNGFAFFYLVFIVLHLPALAFILVLWRHIPHHLRALVVVNSAVLLALPFFNFGINNDLVMCASIASLTILAFVFGLVLIDCYTKGTTAAAAVGFILVLLGLPTPITEILRSVTMPRFPISTCSLVDSSHSLGDKGVPTNYVVAVDKVPAWLMDVSTDHLIQSEPSVCWPGINVHADKFPRALQTPPASRDVLSPATPHSGT